ncbi:dynamin family protein [Dolichospermum planctonicum CS-1226]|uniref:Dynamin family protein n=1 Tax=Dolichospermum planctonicum CS-1226 TaxID=3021751 RepID=A0ABT5AEG4_9CYAN|nr:dynamin family protein [Dolichospermum planctonicum]MDB9535673.1 dynamin family protein [Dolichospermum planctonicum CS-1226]
MSNSVYKVFAEIEFKATLLAQYWHNFRTEISQHLPESYQPEIQELTDNLEKALNQLVYELQNPTLTLATTGTTSSGKSTLVNLLCGAEIVPVAVSEMSAGAVTIEYNTEKSLIIHETPGALWECGEWRGISDDKIYQRLYQAMISYIENRETQPNLACPQSTITYPFRLLKESQLQLPKATRVRILDLPGLAYVGDQGNANVIKQCREALCIVTYNSAETDSQKVKSLLQEVVQQVKDLGGSPARMLFALNRIDVFRADRSWPESENRFVEKAIRDIKNELTEQLKEYTEDIENLKVVKLSTWPALLALQIQNQDDFYSAEACKKADNHFNGLIEDILEDLPRNTQKWNRHDKNRVAEALWEKSYGEEFQENLREHINKHFPQLVIPQIIERFNIAAGNAIAEWATQTTNAVLNSSEERYQEECEKISQIRSSIERFLQVSDTNLREPFEKLDTKVKQVLAEELKHDTVNYIKTAIAELQNVQPYKDKELGEKLSPLFGWRDALRKGLQEVLEAVAKSLETGKIDLNNPNLKKANISDVNLLSRNLNRLVKLGYTAAVAKEGKTMEAKTEEEKNQLQQINEELNELAIHLNIVIEDVLKQISTQELNRIYEAVSQLFRHHLSYTEEGSKEIAKAHDRDISIKFPDYQINQVDHQLTFNFQFTAGFAITQGTWQEKIEIEKKRRDWYTLWLWEQTFYETQYQTRSSDNAQVPSVEDLLAGWIIQSQSEQIKIVNQIARWLLEQIDVLKKNVNNIQNDILDRYQEKLDKANQEITLNYEKQKDVWLPMQAKAQNLSAEFSGLETSWKFKN